MKQLARTLVLVGLGLTGGTVSAAPGYVDDIGVEYGAALGGNGQGAGCNEMKSLVTPGQSEDFGAR